MTNTIQINTDGDFRLPELQDIIKFGNHSYLIVTTIDPIEYISTLIPIMPDQKLGGDNRGIDLFSWYLSHPDTFVEFGNYSMTITQLPQTPDEILNAASIISPLIKD